LLKKIPYENEFLQKNLHKAATVLAKMPMRMSKPTKIEKVFS
jgi:hypothetical protein